MNELVTTQHNETELAISTETKELIQSSVPDSTLKWYTRLSKELEHSFVPQSENLPIPSGFSWNGTDKSGVIRC